MRSRILLIASVGGLAAGLPTAQPGDAAGKDIRQISYGQHSYELYPATLSERPSIPSPFRAPDGLEVLTACTENGGYALVPVTITPGKTTRPWEAPLAVDLEDFPTLAETGRHSEAELDRMQSITGRSLADITELARPGRLSDSGFMAEDEDILSVMKGDNRLVTRLGLTHRQLATPLLHVCNLIGTLYRDSGQRHTNAVFYGGNRLSLNVEFSRGGQKSIFNDGLDGAWTIRVRRELTEKEQSFLNRSYTQLGPTRRSTLVRRLTEMMTGELQPFYIYRYGFYEGHTAWRADPIAIAFLFGLRPLEEIEAAFPGQLHAALTRHFIAKP